MPSFESIEAFYLRAWRDAGFEDTYQEQSYKRAGLEQLREFVERQNQILITADQVLAEVAFRFPLGDVELEGRIDQINPLGARDDHAAELVDYKTGRPRSQKDADQSLQLSIYALAAREQLHLKPARLTFYNLTNNHRLSGSWTQITAKRTPDYLNSADPRFPGSPNQRDFVSIRPLASLSMRSTREKSMREGVSVDPAGGPVGDPVAARGGHVRSD